MAILTKEVFVIHDIDRPSAQRYYYADFSVAKFSGSLSPFTVASQPTTPCIILDLRSFLGWMLHAVFHATCSLRWRLSYRVPLWLEVRVSALSSRSNGLTWANFRRFGEIFLGFLEILKRISKKSETEFLNRYDGPVRMRTIFLKLINNSWRENKGNHYREGGLEMWS